MGDTVKHLFHWKIWNCCIVYDWRQEELDRRGKDLQRATLLELVAFLTHVPDAIIYDLTYPLVVLLVRHRLCRRCFFRPRLEVARVRRTSVYRGSVILSVP